MMKRRGDSTGKGSTGKGSGTNAPPGRRMRGFEPAAGLLHGPIRNAGESRGFASSRVLTQWAEIAGPDLAPLCRPVRVSYAEGGFGATLTLLTSGAAAPMVQMQLPRLKERINAVYGYAAIARIRVTQTSGEIGSAPPGLAEAQAAFTPAPAGMRGKGGGASGEASNIAPPSGQALGRARAVLAGLTDGVADPDLRAALDRLADNLQGMQKGGGKPPHRH